MTKDEFANIVYDFCKEHGLAECMWVSETTTDLYERNELTKDKKPTLSQEYDQMVKDFVIQWMEPKQQYTYGTLNAVMDMHFRWISTERIQKILRHLTFEGLICRTKRGKKTYFYLP